MKIASATRRQNATHRRHSKMRRPSTVRRRTRVIRENSEVSLGLRKRSLLFTSEDRASAIRNAASGNKSLKACGKQYAIHFSKISVCLQHHNYDGSTAAEPDVVWCDNGGALRVSASDIWLALDTMKAVKHEASLALKTAQLKIGVCPANVDKMSARLMGKAPKTADHASFVSDSVVGKCSSEHNDPAAKDSGTCSGHGDPCQNLSSTEALNLLDAKMEAPHIEVRCFVLPVGPAASREQIALLSQISQIVFRCGVRLGAIRDIGHRETWRDFVADYASLDFATLVRHGRCR